MGNCYTLYMFDEFGWDYHNWSYDKQVDKINKLFIANNINYFEFLESGDNHLIIIDTDKRCPDYTPLNEIILSNCDDAYYRIDHGTKLHHVKKAHLFA